jgi:hypothetical protein
MPRCTFCHRPAEQRLWARRWPVRDGRRQQDRVEDVRIALCSQHLALRVFRRRLLVKEHWAYG